MHRTWKNNKWTHHEKPFCSCIRHTSGDGWGRSCTDYIELNQENTFLPRFIHFQSLAGTCAFDWGTRSAFVMFWNESDELWLGTAKDRFPVVSVERLKKGLVAGWCTILEEVDAAWKPTEAGLKLATTEPGKERCFSRSKFAPDLRRDESEDLFDGIEQCTIVDSSFLPLDKSGSGETISLWLEKT